MKTVFENDVIKVLRTGRSYDFIAIIENKTDKEVNIIFDDEEMKFYNFSVDGNSWVGLLANSDGYASLEELKAKRFRVV